jgi:hypothetical protein
MALAEATTFSVQNVAGRLVEVRVSTPMRPADVEALQSTLLRAVEERRSAVVCLDLRGAGVLNPVSLTQVAHRIRAANPYVERAALLLDSNKAVVSMQMERLVREAALPTRRAFRSAAELAAWLDEILTPRERIRLTAFLHSVPSVRSAG